MPWFTRPTRPGPVLRARLRLESLDDRAVPSSLSGGDSESTFLVSYAGPDPSGSGAPEIVFFNAGRVSYGWYCFTGKVELSPSAGGLTVTFGGVPSLEGLSVTTASDGSFSLTVALRTDGSDDGTVTARTVANGQQSNVATYLITPSS